MQERGKKGGESTAAKAQDNVLQVDITKQNAAAQSAAEGTTEAIASITRKPTKVGSKTVRSPVQRREDAKPG